MTLNAFKSRLKFLTIAILLILYGSGFYLLGRFSPFDKIIKVNKEAPEARDTLEESVELPIPFVDTQKGSVIASFVKLCANTVYAFELIYPKDWFTTYLDDSQMCTFFAPYKFVIPQDTTNFATPIKLEVIESVSWQETLKFYQNPNDFQNILSSENLEINGRPVQKIRAITTQSAFVPPGSLKISYLFFDSKHPVIITYQQLAENEDTRHFEEILKEMTVSLKIF